MLHTSDAVLFEKRGDSLVIVFNRPERRSPLSEAVVDELLSALQVVAPSGDCSRIIFSGRDGVFASGADLNEIDTLSSTTAEEFARKGQGLMDCIANCPVETIAAIDGYCFGGALDLAISCRRRIASPRSRFCHPGVGLGIITGWGGTQRLPRLVGEARALEMLLTARTVGAEEALEIGLVDQVVDEPLKMLLD
jgi:enoyl-CoA hydratase